MDRQRGRVPKADFSDHTCFQWDQAITIIQGLLAGTEEGSKAEYLFKNFIEFAKVEALGMDADIESFLMKCENEKAARLMHQYFTEYGYLPTFSRSSDPRTLDYKKGRVSHVTIDLLQNRLIYKFGNWRYKETKLQLIKDFFGRYYVGVHDDIPTEACIHLEDINHENIQRVFDVFSTNVGFRKG